MGNIVNIVVDQTRNQVIAGLDNVIPGSVPRFPADQQPFGVVVQLPANDLNELVVVGDHTNSNFKVSLAPGFPNLSRVRITRNVGGSGILRTPVVTLEADWTTASSPVDLTIPNVGTYNIKGNVKNLTTSVADPFQDNGPFVLDVDGTVESAAMSRPGNYTITGAITQGTIAGTSRGQAVLITPDCSTVTVGANAQCNTVASPSVPPESLPCTEEACALTCQSPGSLVAICTTTSTSTTGGSTTSAGPTTGPTTSAAFHVPHGAGILVATLAGLATVIL